MGFIAMVVVVLLYLLFVGCSVYHDREKKGTKYMHYDPVNNTTYGHPGTDKQEDI